MSTPSSAPEPFTGIPVAALDFYDDLEADNSTTFWAARRDEYRLAVRGPMSALLAELEPEFGRGKLFRPNRDLRFSKDKSPYKTHQGLYVEASAGVGYYVQIDAEGLLVAAGYWGQTPERTAALRATIDGDRTGPDIARSVAHARRAGFEITGERVRTRPRGVPADHPRLELMRHRTLHASVKHASPAWIDSRETYDRVVATWRTLTPLVDTLVAATRH